MLKKPIPTLPKPILMLKKPASRPVSRTALLFPSKPASRPVSRMALLSASKPSSRASIPQTRVVIRFLPPPCPDKPHAAKILQADGQHLVAVVDVPQDGILLINERFWPGWSATLDFRPVPLLRANVLMQAVVVPKGRHTLHLTYRSRWVFVGLALWGLAWLITLASLAMTVLWAEPTQPTENT
jgi:hypothetical protein